MSEVALSGPPALRLGLNRRSWISDLLAGRGEFKNSDIITGRGEFRKFRFSGWQRRVRKRSKTLRRSTARARCRAGRKQHKWCRLESGASHGQTLI